MYIIQFFQLSGILIVQLLQLWALRLVELFNKDVLSFINAYFLSEKGSGLPSLS